MNKFKHYIRLSLNEELDNNDIKGVLMALKRGPANIFEMGTNNVAVLYHTQDGKHVYDIGMSRNVTEDEGEAILEIINAWTTNDFLMEVTTNERYDLPEGEVEMDITSMKHNKWMSEQVGKGWRYGLEFNESEKTDPRLRPYHELTEKLRNI